MRLTTGIGANIRHFEIQGRTLVDLENDRHNFEFETETKLHQWVGARLNNGIAKLYN